MFLFQSYPVIRNHLVFSLLMQVHEAANIIQKLSLIAQELPSERYEQSA